MRGTVLYRASTFPKHSVKKDKAAKILDFFQDFGFFTTNLQIIIIGKLCNFIFLSTLDFGWQQWKNDSIQIILERIPLVITGLTNSPILVYGF